MLLRMLVPQVSMELERCRDIHMDDQLGIQISDDSFPQFKNAAKPRI